jgi:hypothetical protein
MRAQFSYPPTRVSTNIEELESYLRQAAEFFGRQHRNAFSAAGAGKKKADLRGVLSRRVAPRSVISRPKSY